MGVIEPDLVPVLAQLADRLLPGFVVLALLAGLGPRPLAERIERQIPTRASTACSAP